MRRALSGGTIGGIVFFLRVGSYVFLVNLSKGKAKKSGLSQDEF
mgnify:CR=1 FL=1